MEGIFNQQVPIILSNRVGISISANVLDLSDCGATYQWKGKDTVHFYLGPSTKWVRLKAWLKKKKPKCDIEVKKSKSDVMLGLHFS